MRPRRRVRPVRRRSSCPLAPGRNRTPGSWRGDSGIVDVPPDQVENRRQRAKRDGRHHVRGGTMKRGGWRPSPLTVAVALVVAAATSWASLLTNRSVASQNQALLKSDTTQAAEYVSSIVSGVRFDPRRTGVRCDVVERVVHRVRSPGQAAGTGARHRDPGPQDGARVRGAAVAGSGLRGRPARRSRPWRRRSRRRAATLTTGARALRREDRRPSDSPSVRPSSPPDWPSSSS